MKIKFRKKTMRFVITKKAHVHTPVTRTVVVNGVEQDWAWCLECMLFLRRFRRSYVKITRPREPQKEPLLQCHQCKRKGSPTFSEWIPDNVEIRGRGKKMFYTYFPNGERWEPETRCLACTSWGGPKRKRITIKRKGTKVVPPKKVIRFKRRVP